MTETTNPEVEETTQFTIGVAASCSDGVCGEVSSVVVDPVAEVLTHLVVEPTQRRGLGKLVPLELVDSSIGEVRLRCTLAEFDALEAAEETQFLPGTSNYPGYDPGHVVSWPYYGMAGVTRGGIGLGVGNMSPPVTLDVLPPGEVAVRRGEQVHATDGDIGKVQGLVVDPSDHRVTHVLLQEGHLWGRKEVAIPIDAVTDVHTEGIVLGISKQEVHDLPSVGIAR